MDIVERLRIRADLKSPNDFVKQRRIETEAADEIERLQLREETLSGIIDGMTARFIEAQGAVEEIERLREALKFYANEDHYEPQKVWTTSMPQYEPDGYKLVTPVLADKGTRAKAAIAKETGGE